jgi:c-di-GMP-binding flagellar brake protein YcgR
VNGTTDSEVGLDQNQRSETRAKTSDYYLVFERETGEMLGRLADISETGMKIVAPEPLPEGTTIACQLVFAEPLLGMSEIEFDATHVWSRENDEAGWHEIGYVFSNLPDDVRKTIATLIEKLLQEETARVNKILETEK